MYYFTSDVHLGAGDETFSRRTEQRFVKWLDKVAEDADAIFLVGDIFDFWFEYGRVIPKGFVRVLGKLAELTDRGIKIYFFIGNHDMWCRDYLEKECGVKTFFKPQHMTLAGKEVFIAHGDNMNVGNQPMLRLMNTCFRSRILRKLFSWCVHPDLALKFGQWWSGKSRKSH
ncbi:MAG: UDP-2,3-diacylglucosamine diphosphatase, partial [Alistipes sp.]|nr:UDP-2,3-diacylglucosamine diphosphatase [Alistipes sp.]